MSGLGATELVLGAATVLGAVGMGLLLPSRRVTNRLAGGLLALVGLVLIASQLPSLTSTLELDPDDAAEVRAAQAIEATREAAINSAIFFVLAGITVASAAATVTARNPVYSAIWFGMSLLGTGGLLLFQGAQFLGVATIVVYAGAILVTFLFVLMLAQPSGQAFYDRLTWERLLSAATGALVIGVLTLAMVTAFHAPPRVRFPIGDQEIASTAEPKPTGLKPAADTDLLPERILSSEHVARLGGQLFGRHLVAVEIAGTLLLVALVGAIAIAAQTHPLSPPQPRPRPGATRHG